jgi:hypothetical protein
MELDTAQTSPLAFRGWFAFGVGLLVKLGRPLLVRDGGDIAKLDVHVKLPTSWQYCLLAHAFVGRLRLEFAR